MLSPWHENKYYINRRSEWLKGNKNKNVLCDHQKGNLSSFPEAFCLQTKQKNRAGPSDVRTLSGHMAVAAQTLTTAQPVTSHLQDSLSVFPPGHPMKQHNTHTHTHTNLVGHWPAGLSRAGRESFTVNWTRTGFLWESPSLTAAKIPATQTTPASKHTHTHTRTHAHTQIDAYTPWNWDTLSHLLLVSLS